MGLWRKVWVGVWVSYLVSGCASNAPPAAESAAAVPPPSPAQAEPLKVQGTEAESATPAASNTIAAPRPCNGSAPQQLQSALSARAGSARSCYEKLLQDNPKASGRLVVDVRISESGAVDAADALEDSMESDAFRECVLNRFRNSTFPAPEAGCAEVRIPLRFMPKKPEEEKPETPAQP